MPRTKQISASQRITDNAQQVYKTIMAKKSPTMSTPIRSLSNVKYHPKMGHFEMLGKSKKRTLTVNTVKTFAQTLKMMALSKQLIEEDNMAT
ncbi:MAG: DNA topoisomerase IV subunit A, partial [Planctomycetota bacterium]